MKAWSQSNNCSGKCPTCLFLRHRVWIRRPCECELHDLSEEHKDKATQGGNSVPKAYLFQKENITKSWVLFSLCQQTQHMNRLNHLYVTFTLLKKLRSREGVASNVQREIIYQPWSKALRMATSMSWCSSELMWNTVICFPGKEIALLTCFHRYSPDLYTASDIWSIFFSKKQNSRTIKLCTNKRAGELSCLCFKVKTLPFLTSFEAFVLGFNFCCMTDLSLLQSTSLKRKKTTVEIWEACKYVPILCSSCTPWESERDGWHRSGWS